MIDISPQTVTSLQPAWVVKLMRRLLQLPEGRYILVLDVSRHSVEWRVSEVGRLER